MNEPPKSKSTEPVAHQIDESNANEGRYINREIIKNSNSVENRQNTRATSSSLALNAVESINEIEVKHESQYEPNEMMEMYDASVDSVDR